MKNTILIIALATGLVACGGNKSNDSDIQELEQKIQELEELNKPEPEKNCRVVAVDYLSNAGLKILFLNDEGYVGGVCNGGPGQYCGRVEKFINGQYWTYDIVVFTEKDQDGNCTVKGSKDNLN